MDGTPTDVDVSSLMQGSLCLKAMKSGKRKPLSPSLHLYLHVHGGKLGDIKSINIMYKIPLLPFLPHFFSAPCLSLNRNLLGQSLSLPRED